MKQKHLFIALAIVSATLFTGCDTDKSDNNLSQKDITGTWYDPVYNEEIQYISSGRFYDKFCNRDYARYTEGTYQISGNKLKETYSLLGRMIDNNLTITDFVKGNHFTFSSNTIGEHVYYYVSETINMNPGETATAATSGLTSPDTRIVTVDGSTLTAAGQKGTIYMRNGDGTYTKVVVGEETHDLWYDYSALLGASFSTVTSTLGTPDQTADGRARYIPTLQSTIQYVVVFLDASNNVNQIELHLRDAVSDNDILSYLEKKYFKLADNNLVGTQYQYYSNNTLADSKFVVAYDTSNKTVLIVPRPGLLPDYTKGLGGTKENFISLYGQGLGEAGEISPFTIYIINNAYAGSVSIRTNQSGRVDAYFFHLRDNIDMSAVRGFLDGKYYKGNVTDTWVNNSVRADATIGIELEEKDNLLWYFYLK